MASSGTLLILDDLQWADEGPLAYSYLPIWSTRSMIVPLAVGLACHVEPLSWHLWSRLAAVRSVRRLPLRRLRGKRSPTVLAAAELPDLQPQMIDQLAARSPACRWFSMNLSDSCGKPDDPTQLDV